MESMVTEVERSGDWMPAEGLMDKSLSLLGEDKDITLNLDKVEYLDANAPQTLLAFDMEQKKLGAASTSGQCFSVFTAVV